MSEKQIKTPKVVWSESYYKEKDGKIEVTINARVFESGLLEVEKETCKMTETKCFVYNDPKEAIESIDRVMCRNSEDYKNQRMLNESNINKLL